ncbi:MAG: DUF4112 domain-containing protein [Pseudomonadales bacterium]|nr:DUF4112 domain-containing protein [Pseudomonadales bacterium]
MDQRKQQEEIAYLRAKEKHLKRLSVLLDDAFTIPGTNITIGWDAILGFLPVIGDALGAILSSYIVFQAQRIGVSGRQIFRMLLNIGIELLVGLVPVFGDFFDVSWRANRKNYLMIQTHIDQQLKQLGSQPTAPHEKHPKTSPMIWTWLIIAILAAMLIYLRLFEDGWPQLTHFNF